MNGIRRDLAALAAQMAAEPNRVLVLTEGETDRFAISRWARDAAIPVDAYHIQDFDITLSPKFIPYGGNKGRICSLFDDPWANEFRDRNLIGIIDRDLDGIIRDEIEILGVYYTDGSSFFTFLLHPDKLKELLERTFRKHVPEKILDACTRVGTKLLLLKGFLQVQDEPVSTVAIKSYVNKDESKYFFDWDDYINSVALKAKVDSKSIHDFIDFHFRCDSGCVDYHLFVQFLYLAGRKIGFFENSVTENEIKRHIERSFFEAAHETTIARILVEKTS